MTAPSETYVDPSINANSGTGTIGDPYGDLQYALDQTTRDATNGDRFNVKAGTAEVLTAALDMTTYGTASFDAPVVIQGYTSAAGDGGKGEIDGNATYPVFAGTTYENIYFIDLKMGNCGSASYVLGVDRYVGVYDCEIHSCTGRGIQCSSGGYTHIHGCHIHNIGTEGFFSGGVNTSVTNCYFANGTNKFSYAIRQDSVNDAIAVIGNIFSLDSTSNGLFMNNWGFGTVYGNSFFTSGTGAGFKANGMGEGPCINNVFEGFNIGIDTDSGSNTDGAWGVIRQNAFYDCNTDISTDNFVVYTDDNESLGATPFAKSGSDTFANRFTYFAPVDTGNVYSGYPSGSNIAKGAVQPSRINASPKHPLGRF